jgi:CDGSH-type Zn-finger protein
MTQPVITQKKPFAMELDPGEYWWCACGKSKSQPFCDGSHQGTDLSPHKFVIKEKQMVWLCGCKHSETMPYCDGTHKKL